MPASKLGGYKFRDMMAAFAVTEDEDSERLEQAIEYIFTEGKTEAAKLIREVLRNQRLRARLHTLLQANDVDEARQIFNNEILPALSSGKKGE